MRKDDTNEWVSISDLMSGVTAMVMLLLVVAVVQSAVTKSEQEKIKKKGVVTAMDEIGKELSSLKNVEGILLMDSVIRLTDQAFTSGSACLSKDTKKLLKEVIAPILIDNMEKYPNLSIQFEGHTDPTPVGKISIDLEKGCALFDDNYSLSAGRAREARRALLSSISDSEMSKDLSKRISVVGYGPDRLIDTDNPKSPKNRRVEIRLVVIQ